LIADSTKAFAEACLRLLSEPETRQRLVASAWEYIRSYNEVAVQKIITESLSQLALMASAKNRDYTQELKLTVKRLLN
jgi:hypothetical protein